MTRSTLKTASLAGLAAGSMLLGTIVGGGTADAVTTQHSPPGQTAAPQSAAAFASASAASAGTPRGGYALAGTTGAPPPSAAPSNPGVTPQCGLGAPFYSVGNATPAFTAAGTRYEFTGSPGTPLSVSMQRGTSWSGTVGGSGQFDISAIVASAKATVSGSITYTTDSSATLTVGPWTVPTNQSRWGWVAIGSTQYRMNWYKYVQLSTCAFEKLGSGIASLPTVYPAGNHGLGTPPPVD